MRYSIFGYLIGEGFRNVFKNKKSTIASLIIMCATMFVFGIFFVVGENVNHVTKTIEEQQGMEVFIDDAATQAQTTELGNKIRSLDYVNQVTYKTKEEALEQMKKIFKGKKDLIASYEGENNPFRASYVVTLTDLSKAEEVQNQISTYDMVAKITIKSDTIVALVKIADGIKIISGVILVILVFISVFIITPDGYKTIEKQDITVKDTKEKQEVTVTTRKLIFDVGLEKKLKNIIVDGHATNVANTDELMKVEVKERKIASIKLQLDYSITVVNKGETLATVEEIADHIPSGFTYEPTGSSNWKVDKQEAIYEEAITLKPGESKELSIRLNWNNNTSNFGEKKNTAELVKVTNPYGYKNSNANNGGDSASLVISVGTGLEEKITIVRIIVIALTACMTICLMAGIEIMILKRKK